MVEIGDAVKIEGCNPDMIWIVEQFLEDQIVQCYLAPDVIGLTMVTTRKSLIPYKEAPDGS